MRNESLSASDFERIRALIYQEAGINLTAEKKTMTEMRLRRRLSSLELSSCSEYCEHLFGPGGRETELIHLIDAVTTNKTDFFREPGHFDYLLSRALPDLASLHGARRKALIWSAGCSTGEEAYTLAMLLDEYAQSRPGFQFSILATDISTAVLDKARLGVFKSEHVAPVPPGFQRKYFMRSRNPGSDLMRVVPELRAQVEFRRINLMDADYGLQAPPEVIFCRNVIIYFDRATQVRLLDKLVRRLMPGGYFFAGHSESLHNMNLPLLPVAPSVYRKAPQ
jgi:chemotaxis protein methyltransferase CheR